MRSAGSTFLCLSEQIFAADAPALGVGHLRDTEEFTGEPRVMEPDKLPEFGWFDLDALPQPLSRFAADAVAALRATAGRPLSA